MELEETENVQHSNPPLHFLSSDHPGVSGIGEENRADVIEKFVEMDRFDVDERFSPLGRTALHEAAMLGYLEIAEVLIDAGADVDAPDFDSSRVPLDYAVTNEHLDLTKLLLDNGAKIHTPSSDHNLLHTAVETGNPELVRILLDAGADVDQLNSRGGNPLYTAVRELNGDCRNEIMNILSQHGARHDKRKKEGVNLLQACARYGAIDWIDQLLDEDFDVDYQDDKGRTALHFSVMDPRTDHKTLRSSDRRTLKTLDRLLRENPEINIQDHKGRTPLHYAAESGHLYATTLLLENRPDPTVMDDNSHTAAQVAGQHSNYETASRLQDAETLWFEL